MPFPYPVLTGHVYLEYGDFPLLLRLDDGVLLLVLVEHVDLVVQPLRVEVSHGRHHLDLLLQLAEN